MLPRRLNTIGSALDTDLRSYMAYVVAKALGCPAHSLPVMNDVELWELFKFAARVVSRYVDIPTALAAPLNPGDIFAIEAGLLFATREFPAGNDPEEISDRTISFAKNTSDDSLYSMYQQAALNALYFVSVPYALKKMKHPKEKEFLNFLKDYLGYVEEPTDKVDLEALCETLSIRIASNEGTTTV
jgi:hypothetical protein